MTKSKKLDVVIERLKTLNKTELVKLLSFIEAELLFRDKKYTAQIENQIRDFMKEE